MKINSLKDLEALKIKGKASLYPEGKIKVSVGMATCGLATGAQAVYDTMERVIKEEKAGIILRKTGCLGYCQKEPIVDVIAPGRPRLIYSEVTPHIAEELIKAINNGNIHNENLLCKITTEEILIQGETVTYDGLKDSAGLKDVPEIGDVPFFSRQLR